MIALHRLPVVRKAMLVLVPMAFLHQEVAFNPPRMSRPKITALMRVLPADGFARQPGMFGMLSDNRSLHCLLCSIYRRLCRQANWDCLYGISRSIQFAGLIRVHSDFSETWPLEPIVRIPSHAQVLTQIVPGKGCQPSSGRIFIPMVCPWRIMWYVPATIPRTSSAPAENRPLTSAPSFNKGRSGIAGENSKLISCRLP
jgi:hypothetical protein